jgi:hypothetical protein
MTCLAEGYLRTERHAEARDGVETVLRISRETGYQHLEGVGLRLLAQCLAPEAPAVATRHALEACTILERAGAANELAKALADRAELERRAGHGAAARSLVEDALARFEKLGTVGEPQRLRTLLDALGRDATRRRDDQPVSGFPDP